tara:strand:+ start:210 stop:962 length:753 start_codon:yes stop_codon:yes gene_type:complete
MAEQKKQNFPTEVIDLPSEGKLYPKEHPLSSGKIELKYMTAKEEDILTSQNLIKKGLAVEKLLDSLIVTEGVNINDLLLGDKNAVMVATRVLAYGSEYTCEVINPNTSEAFEHTFSLADCPFKKVPQDVSENKFNFELPVSKINVEFKILTGKEEKLIDTELTRIKKVGSDITPELTTRLRHVITSVDGDDTPATINNFAQNMLARDSLSLRQEIQRISPDIELKQNVEIGGDVVEVNIPLTTEFFWPKA